jgi:hypothetical protein
MIRMAAKLGAAIYIPLFNSQAEDLLGPGQFAVLGVDWI